MRYLRIYLNDHLAASIAGGELAKRCLKNNEGTPLGDFLERLIKEIDDDRAGLRTVMEAVGGSEDPFKKAGAIAAEKLGRLKLNGQIRGYSPLSRVVELDGLTLGVSGKRGLWTALKLYSSDEPSLKVVDYDALIQRAESQLAGLEEHRLEAAQTAFAAGR